MKLLTCITLFFISGSFLTAKKDDDVKADSLNIASFSGVRFPWQIDASENAKGLGKGKGIDSSTVSIYMLMSFDKKKLDIGLSDLAKIYYQNILGLKEIEVIKDNTKKAEGEITNERLFAAKAKDKPTIFICRIIENGELISLLGVHCTKYNSQVKDMNMEEVEKVLSTLKFNK